MIRLHLFGSIDLHRGDDARIESVLAQPKRTALLAYLASANPGGLVRRESLLAVFWPDLDESHARNALSKALSHLRRSLGEGAVLTVGMNEVGLSQEHVWSDVAAFERAVAHGRHDDAVDLYSRGLYLEGFSRSGLPEFERWVEGKGEALRRMAGEALEHLILQAEASGDLPQAVRLARQATAVEPYSEPMLRRLLALLDAIGDRAGAVQVYLEFEDRLERELDLTPSPKTRELERAIRERATVGETDEIRLGGSPPSEVVILADGPPSWVGDRKLPRAPPGAQKPDEKLSESVAVAKGPSPRGPGAGAAWPWIFAALALGFVGATWMVVRGTFWTTDDRPIPSLAVLHLTDLAGDADREYFAHGLTEQLTTELAKIGGLRVLSRASVIAYQDAEGPAAQVGQALGADLIVEGAVASAGGRIRINARLIDTATDRHLWAESYDRPHTDVLAMQADIARSIAREVRVRVTPEEERRLAGSDRPIHPEAHQAFLRGQYWLSQLQNAPADFEEFKTMIAAFEEAVRLDSDWADAHAHLALAHHWAAPAGPRSLPERELHFVSSRGAVLRALELDPDHAQANLSRGWIAHNWEWDWQTAEESYRRYYELEPNFWWGNLLLLSAAHYDAAIRSYEEALTRNPAFLGLYLQAGDAYLCAGQEEEALRAFKHVRALDPARVDVHRHVAETRLRQGRHQEAVSSLDRADEACAGREGCGRVLAWRRALVQALMGREAEARELLAGGPPGWMEVPGVRFVSDLLVALGEEDEAATRIEEAFLARHTNLLVIHCWWSFERLRHDPRVQEVMERIGFPATLNVLGGVSHRQLPGDGPSASEGQDL